MVVLKSAFLWISWCQWALNSLLLCIIQSIFEAYSKWRSFVGALGWEDGWSRSWMSNQHLCSWSAPADQSAKSKSFSTEFGRREENKAKNEPSWLSSLSEAALRCQAGLCSCGNPEGISGWTLKMYPDHWKQQTKGLQKKTPNLATGGGSCCDGRKGLSRVSLLRMPVVGARGPERMRVDLPPVQCSNVFQ